MDFFIELECIWIVLRKIYDQFFCLRDKLGKITKKVLEEVTSFNAWGDVSTLRITKKYLVTQLTKLKWDWRAMTIEDIKQEDVMIKVHLLNQKIGEV